MGQPVVHFEINGRDGEALASFYGQLFDWELEHLEQMNYRMVHTNAGRGIDGGIGQPESGEQQWVTIYVEVDDPEATLQQVGELGGRTLMPAMEIPGGPTIAIFSDPEGHVVGLVKSEEG